MHKIIKTNNLEILVKIKSFINAKSVKIFVRSDGQVVLTKPTRLSALAINRFLTDKIGWLEQALRSINVNNNIRVKINSSNDYKKNAKKARELVQVSLQKFAYLYQAKVNRVSIRNQRTRWGSCSGRGNLNFNYRLVFLRPELIDYIVVHELCHLQEFNHSASFWRLVSLAIPNYKILRQELKATKIV